MREKKQILPYLSNFPFRHELKTRWKDMDSFGHANNAVFLTYIEDARITFFKRWNLSFEKKSIIVASVKIDYINQIDHPSNLIIGQKISRIGNKSFDIESIIFNKDLSSYSAVAIVTCVCFDYTNNQSVSVYPEIKADYK